MISKELILFHLQQLDRILGPAIPRAESALNAKYCDVSFRGVAIEAADARRGISHLPSFSTATDVADWAHAVDHETHNGRSAFIQMKAAFHISVIDFGVLLLAIAPEFDSGYERLFGFLQDDVTRRRASVELATALFDPDGTSTVLAALNDSQPLLANRMIELADAADSRPGWATKVLRLNDQFARWILGIKCSDRDISNLAQVVRPVGLGPGFSDLAATLGRLAKPIRLYVHGPDGAVNLQTAESAALAVGKNKRMLVADSFNLVTGNRATESVRLLRREAFWFNYLLVLTGTEVLHTNEHRAAWEQIAAVLSKPPLADVVLVGGRPTLPTTEQALRVLSLEIPLPDAYQREEHWDHVLGTKVISAGDVKVLADRYSLTRTQIERAKVDADGRAQLRAAMGQEPTTITFEDLSIAARTQGGHELETLTHKIRPQVCLTDVVAPADVHAQLNEIVARVLKRDKVFREWGFGQRHSYGFGVNALFAGPSGTGKTMAAEALANALDKDLYKIDLTTVVSKYIGETEQKLEQVFRAGETTQAVLFFDEADSLLGKRSEVKDAHDRYANLEVSYLLQRMERYDGLIILATNLLANLDDAFLRRLAAVVHFAQPAVAERRILWEKAWPRGYVFADKPDFDFLAEHFELTGGNIRNAVLAAAFAAANRGDLVTMWDILQGVRREYQKLGQLMTDQELGLDQFAAPPDPLPAPKKQDHQAPECASAEVGSEA